MTDTIVAISSAPGRAALSIVRLSGPDVPVIARQLLTPYPEIARQARLTVARDPVDNVILDRLVSVRYDAPSSYTGEAMLELYCHGGQATSRAVLSGCLALGARTAQPGEFTRRALLNGKLDLAQAEALPDLIDAASEPMRRVALGTVGGGLSKRVGELRNTVLHLEALMAYSVDFPEEDDGEVPAEMIVDLGRSVGRQVKELLESAGRGAIIRDGALVVFAGPPNVGKSSLFNALLGQERAIVTEVAGTTRDAVEHPCMIEAWPVRLVDTAGLRDSDNLVERLGIEVSQRYVKDADVAIVCSDGSGAPLDELSASVRALGASETVCVETKADLQARSDGESPALRVSAKTGSGLGELRTAIAHSLERRYGRIEYESPIITHTRHKAMLERATQELALFVDGMESGITPTIAGTHLRAAVGALDEIIGAISVDDLLDQVFSRFCIGK